MSTVEETRTAVLAAAVKMSNVVPETTELLLKLLEEKIDIVRAMEANARKLYNTMRIDKPEKVVETSNNMKPK
jgi:hypothetical protein